MAKKVLLVSTSAGQMGEHPTGLWISELAEPYTVFTKAGFDVTIASIAGGAVPIDAGSLAEQFFAPDAKAFMHDAKAFGALSHSVKVDASMAGQYDAVCLCGGHGTCVFCVEIELRESRRRRHTGASTSTAPRRRR